MDISRLFRIKRQLAAFAIIVVLSGCGGSDDPKPEPTEAERVTGILTAGGGKWSLPASGGGVLVDGVDVTDDLFPGFSITFAAGTLSTTGTTPVWLRQDTWQFKDATAKVIVRGQDSREITIEEISNSQLKLSLEWPTTTTDGGRQRSSKGKHEFILNK